MILTAAEISRYPIDALALEMVPEAVARERVVLPVAVRDRQLHLLLPVDSPTHPGDLCDVLRFILNQNFSHQLARVEVLRPFIDLYYSAVTAPVAICGAKELRFRCPKQWIDLKPTGDVRVRDCNECERRVTYCTTLGEYQKLASAGECVAYFDPLDQVEYLGMPE